MTRLRNPLSSQGAGNSPINFRTRLAIMADVARETPKNAAMLFPFVRAWRARYPRPLKNFKEITDADLRQFAFSALDMLLDHFPAARIAGSTIVEIGPGDCVVEGIPLLALGASSYHAIDRFMGDVSSQNARRLYQRVAEELPGRYKIPTPAIPDPATYPLAQEGRSVFLYRQGIEDWRSFNLSGRADLVFSHGVGGQVASPGAFSKATYELLKPGGIAIHRIDFGPVVCWDRYRNPLTFLTVNRILWDLVNSHRGLSNRLRFDEFCQLFASSGFDLRTHVRETISREQVEEIRPFLNGSLKAAPTDSLQVMKADFVCLKPG